MASNYSSRYCTHGSSQFCIGMDDKVDTLFCRSDCASMTASWCPPPKALRRDQRGTRPRPGTHCSWSTPSRHHVCCVFLCCRSLGLGVLVATMFMQAQIGLRNANRGGEDHASTYVPKLIDLTLGIALFCCSVVVLFKEFVGDSKRTRWRIHWFKNTWKEFSFVNIVYTLPLKSLTLLLGKKENAHRSNPLIHWLLFSYAKFKLQSCFIGRFPQ